MVIVDIEKQQLPQAAEPNSREQPSRTGSDSAQQVTPEPEVDPCKSRKSFKFDDCPGQYLSRKPRLTLKLGLLFVLFLCIHILFQRRNRKDFEFLRSLVIDEEEPAHRYGLGKYEMLFRPEKAEKLFLSIPDAKSAIAASRKFATHPHLAGSAEDFEDAKTMLDLFQTQFSIPIPDSEPIYAAGSPESRKATLNITSLISPQAWIDIYYPILNTPLNRSLDIVDEQGEIEWSADLVEDGDRRDHDAAEYRDAVPTWHGLSTDGDVTGELVYANYGTQEDYAELVSRGVNLSGKIVITRYGEIFRGLKVKGAQDLGAAGVLIYTDPRDDGSVTVENGYMPYPAGPARNPTSVQRGSVQFISMYPGDPSTPGYPAYENATRQDQNNKPSIPSLPISWKNAERLLEEIATSPGNLELTGAMSKRKVRLVNHVDEKVTPIWNTMAVIPGHLKDEVVLIGNHRDAWVLGGADPTSGTAAMHEVIRGFGALLRTGWKPLRTIVFASWDAEEYGLVGSTEWGEDFPDWIASHVVAYVNVDVASAGSRWIAAASPSLASLIYRTALDIPHPTKAGRTLWDARLDEGPYKGPIDPGVFNTTSVEGQEKKKKITDDIEPLGSGSDFTVFLQRIGIASVDQSFAPTEHDAPYHYHSIYDSQRWQEVYADPGFHRHVAVAKHIGLMSLRLADSIVLPLNTTEYALELDSYLKRVEEIALEDTTSENLKFKGLRKAIRKLQKASRELDSEKEETEAVLRKLLRKMRHGSEEPLKFYDNAEDVAEEELVECNDRQDRLIEKPHGFFSWLSSFFANRREEEYLRRPPARPPTGHPHPHEPTTTTISARAIPTPSVLSCFENFPIRKFIRAVRRVQRVNRKLAAFERGFISSEGIKDREWYRHLGVAPGKWLGYGATTFPALTEALTIEKNATLALVEAKRLEVLIRKLASAIAP